MERYLNKNPNPIHLLWLHHWTNSHPLHTHWVHHKFFGLLFFLQISQPVTPASINSLDAASRACSTSNSQTIANKEMWTFICVIYLLLQGKVLREPEVSTPQALSLEPVTHLWGLLSLENYCYPCFIQVTSGAAHLWAPPQYLKPAQKSLFAGSSTSTISAPDSLSRYFILENKSDNSDRLQTTLHNCYLS